MKTYSIELTAEQLIELNELLHDVSDNDVCCGSGGILNEVKDITHAATWNIMSTDELWECYLDVVGIDWIMENYRQNITRSEMIEALCGR